MKTLIMGIVIVATSTAYAQIDHSAATWLKGDEDIQSMVETVQRLSPVKLGDSLHIVDAKISGDLFALHYEFQMTESQVASLMEKQGLSIEQFKKSGQERTIADLCSFDFTENALNHGARIGGFFSYKNGPIAYAAEVSDPKDCG